MSQSNQSKETEAYTLEINPSVLKVLQYIQQQIPIEEYRDVVKAVYDLAPTVWPYSRESKTPMIRLLPPAIE